MGLLQRIQRRTTLLQSDDFLHRVPWSHLPAVIQLIHMIRANAPEVPVNVDASDPISLQARQQCPFCSFHTTSLPNMRRHMTTQHDAPYHRVSLISPLSMALNGKPQCMHCHHLFSSWKNFFVHVQRDCCQVQPSPMTEPADEPPRQITATEVVQNTFQITRQPFWPDLQSNILTDDWTGLSQQAPALESLTHHCAICGTWCNRFQEMHGHYRLYHHDQLRGGIAKGVQLSHVIQQTSPCPLCQKQYTRVHSCPVTLQIGILRLQMMEPDVRNQSELTCEICVQQFDDTGQLYSHMAQTHGHTLNDWVPSRDSVQGSDKCRHCQASFDSRSGLRRHITEGRCEAFDPAASLDPVDNTQRWGTWLRLGDFSPTGLTAHQRLQLTTVCQFCETKYMRTGDVVAHLLQAHGHTWTASQQMLRYLLQTVMATRGSICNPQAHEVGLAHICTPLRQIAMLMANGDVQLLVPQQFSAAILAPAMEHLNHVTLQQRLIDILVSRDFAQLWTDQTALTGLRSRCMICGGHYQPPELLRHLLTIHPQTSAWATQFAFQLYEPLHRFQQTDFQCNLCLQVFNLPADVPTNALLPRVQTQTSHFVSSCPVVLQIATLLQPINGRPDGPQRSGPHGGIGGAGPIPFRHQETSRRKRRRAPNTSDTNPRPRKSQRPQDSTKRPSPHCCD